MSNEVLENIKSRRSVRTYTERQVSAWGFHRSGLYL